MDWVCRSNDDFALGQVLEGLVLDAALLLHKLELVLPVLQVVASHLHPLLLLLPDEAFDLLDLRLLVFNLSLKLSLSSSAFVLNTQSVREGKLTLICLTSSSCIA